MRKGTLYVFTGPSGAGKGTVLGRLLAEDDRLFFSISATTRAPRPGEQNGVHYYFLEKADFENRIAQGAFLEHAQYVGNYYGTPLQPIREAIEAGTDIVMDVDVVGALKIKKRLPGAVLVFIAAPSFDALRQRLIHRGDVSPEAMAERLERARWEYTQAHQYDYILLNEDVEQTAGELMAIMTAEKCKTMERIHLIKEEL